MLSKRVEPLPAVWKRVGLCLLPPALAAAAFALRGVAVWAAHRLPRCGFLYGTGFYCPGCGNTRSVLALLRGDFPAAVGCNVAPVLGLAVALLAYGELLAWAAGRRLRLVPRSGVFWAVVGAVLAVYYIARNFVPWLTALPLPPQL